MRGVVSSWWSVVMGHPHLAPPLSSSILSLGEALSQKEKGQGQETRVGEPMSNHPDFRWRPAIVEGNFVPAWVLFHGK